MIISRSDLSRMRNVSDKSCRENQNTHVVHNNFFLANHAVYDTSEKIIVELYRPQMKIWCMRIACCVPKTTNTRMEYVILLFHCNDGYTNVIVYCLSCQHLTSRTNCRYVTPS